MRSARRSSIRKLSRQRRSRGEGRERVTKQPTSSSESSVNRARVAKANRPRTSLCCAGRHFPTSPHHRAIASHAAGIAGVALIRGMFRTVGIDPIDVVGATGGLDTD